MTPKALRRITAAVVALGLMNVPCAAQGRTGVVARLRQVRFSPDGRYVLAQDGSTITVLSVQPFSIVFEAPAERATPAQFTPDSKQVVFATSVTQVNTQQIALASGAAHVERWDIAGRARVGSSGVPSPPCLSAMLSPDGRVLACVDFKGTLRLVNVASAETMFEKKNCASVLAWDYYGEFNPFNKSYLGPAEMDFSPDGRYFMVLPWGGDGPPAVWDLHDKRILKVAGGLNSLKSAAANGLSFTFVAPDEVMIIGGRYAKHGVVTVKLVAFPSGMLLLKPKIPPGPLFRAADPNFVLERPFGLRARDTSDARAAAVEFATGQVIVSDTPALDVFGHYYVAEPRNGEVGLYERGKGLQATVTLGEQLPSP